MHTVSGRWRLGLLLSLGTTLLWGVLPIAQKVLLQSMSPLTLTWFRFLMAGLVLGLWLAARGGMPAFGLIRGRTAGLMAVAVLGLLGNYVFYLLGLAYVSPGTTQVVIQLAPVFLVLGSMALFHERFSAGQWLGYGVLCAGLLLFFNQRLVELFGSLGEYSLGVGLVLVSGVSWAGYALAQKQLLKAFPSSAIMLCIYIAGVVLLGPFAEPEQALALNGRDLILLAFCGLNTLIAYGCFAEALAHWEASRVSAVLALGPLMTLLAMELVGVFVPDWLAPESLSALSLAGAALVVSGSMLSALLGAKGGARR
ncbi:MAG: DMT family transporter [Gammaproteobacteria bacterium]|nr:DMT family transporter [Gammaproteobacteria bacterium]